MKNVAMACTWRIIAFTTTMLVVAALTWHANGTADWGSAGLTGAIAGTFKMVFYVLHNKAYERFWNAKETETASNVNPARNLKALMGMGLVKGVVRDANDPLNGDFYVIAD